MPQPLVREGSQLRRNEDKPAAETKSTMAQFCQFDPLVYNLGDSRRTDMEREEKKIFHEHLKGAGLKRTTQRDLILDVFLDTEGHVSSEDLYSIIKARDPSVGFTTVYRTLKLLKECGLARELEFHDGRMLYEHEYKHTHHDHLICTGCGALIEFYNEQIEQLQDEIVRRYRFKPLHHSHRIFGICADCQKAQKAAAKAKASTK